MLVVAITLELPSAERNYPDKREVFRYETTELDIPAVIRATLAADLVTARERDRIDRVERAMREIEDGKYCESGCARSPAAVIRAARRGEDLPVCSGHVAELVR